MRPYPGTGKYRIKAANGRSNKVRVQDGSVAVDVDEQMYKDRNYLPQLEELPWLEP